jgi:hypothetical protein
MISSAARRTLALNKATLGKYVQIRLLSSKKGENKKERLDNMPTKKNQDKATKDKKEEKSQKEPHAGKNERKQAQTPK